MAPWWRCNGRFIALLKRTCTILLIILQAAIFNWYLVHYGGQLHLIWIAGDILVICAFIASFHHADTHFGPAHLQEAGKHDAKEAENFIEKNDSPPKQNDSPPKQNIEVPIGGFNDVIVDVEEPAVEDNDTQLRPLEIGPIRKKYHLGALPLAYLSWTVYSVNLVAKMLVIFLAFENLDLDLLLGVNMVELSLALTACIFAFVVSGHRKIGKGETAQKNVISYMQNRVLMDILDSVEIMEFLYTKEEDPLNHPKIGKPIRDAILALVSIQIILPAMGLYQLSTSSFSNDSKSGTWGVLHQTLNLFLENIPFLIIRIYMWSRGHFTENTFIFITKNAFEIFMNDWEFVNIVMQRIPCFGRRKKPKKPPASTTVQPA